MTAISPDSPALQPEGHWRRRKTELDIPRIRFFSWLGLESVFWGVVIAHMAKWIGNAVYYLIWQLRYTVGAASSGSKPAYTWDDKDWWDRFPVHFQNGLPAEVAAACGIFTLLVVLRLAMAVPAGSLRPAVATAWRGLIATLAGVMAALLTARSLRNWHVHWFATEAVPVWWITWRHDIRDVGIAMFATIVVQLIFTKPKHGIDDNPGLRVYALALPKALLAALIPIAVIAVIAWQVPWMLRHGWQVPADFGALASEVNGFIAKGTWITLVMGIAGAIAARPFIRRIGDDIQWFLGERSADKIRSTAGLNALRGTRVYGSPSHRLRVRWIQANRPESPHRSPVLVRIFLAAGALGVLLAGFGAWLTIVGPAAVH